MEIKIHSMVDNITNSSTEFYVSCKDSSVQYVTEMIDALLHISDKNLFTSDLFDIKRMDKELGSVECVYSLKITPKDTLNDELIQVAETLTHHLNNLFDAVEVYN